MLKERTTRRALLLGLLVLAAVGAAAVLVTPQTEAVGCQGPYGGVGDSTVTSVWSLTPEAQYRTSLGQDCTDPNNAVCREECLVTCGDEVATGNFACFPN